MARQPAEHGLPYFPAFLDLVRKRVVVVGGGQVASTKLRALLPCRPEPLIVVAPQASEFVRREAQAGRLEWRARAFLPVAKTTPPTSSSPDRYRRRGSAPPGRLPLTARLSANRR